MFDFTREEYEEIKEKLMLNDELSELLERKIKGESVVKISLEMNMSQSTVSRRVKLLKKKIMKIIWHFLEIIKTFLNVFFLLSLM